MSTEAQALPTQPSGAVPSIADSDDFQRIRDVLSGANYTDAGVIKVLGVDSLSRLRERRLPALLRRTGGGTPLETLIRLFILGQPCDVAAARRAFAPMGLTQWIEMGLVEATGSLVQATLQLRCYQGLVLAYDFPRRGRGGLRQDYVMGVSPSSLVLVSMTIRRKNRSALDIGTGCGIQAILAARHSERVVAVDCNPRAVAIARFNAQLNQISTVQVREGDMFEPVRGEIFDLIVSNPPFIISPENRHFFLNSGMDSDEICRRIAQEAPRFLSEGGYCIFNANWAVIEGEDWRVRLVGWFQGTGCDGLVIVENIHEIDEYAASFIEVGDDEQPEYQRLFDKWMDYYAERKIAGIGHGVIVMQRVSGRSNWFATDGAPANIAFPSGDDVERLVKLRTFVNSLRDENHLLDARLKLASNVRLEQVCEAVEGSWREVSRGLRRVGGLEYAGSVDGPSAALLAQFDGHRQLREQLKGLATTLNTDLATLTPPALSVIRRLVEQGFLVPGES